MFHLCTICVPSMSHPCPVNVSFVVHLSFTYVPKAQALGPGTRAAAPSLPTHLALPTNAPTPPAVAQGPAPGSWEHK